MKKVVLCTGGFDPLHSGHIAYFKAARKLGNKLVVGLNSDAWLTRKKGRPFMPFEERATIIKNLKMVDDVIAFDDADGTACHAIYQMLSTHGEHTTIVFANGGDRTNGTTPEYEMYKNAYGLEFAWGIGGENKRNSSSWILDEWKTQKTERSWGYWRVLDNKPDQGIKVKELVIYPNSSLSDQRHKHRSEHWYILSGSLRMDTEYNSIKQTLHMNQNDTYVIGADVWHKAVNETDKLCHVLEIQYGEHCVEEDIERRD